MWRLKLSHLIWIYSVCLLDFDLALYVMSLRTVLFCFRSILFLILLLFFTSGLGTSLLHLININLSNVSSFNLHLYGLNTLPPEQPFNSSWRSNVKQYRPLSDCSWSGGELFAQVYICPNIWGKYSLLSLQQVWQIQKYTNSSSL